MEVLTTGFLWILENRLPVKFSKKLFSRSKEPQCIKSTSSKWSGIISPPQPLEEWRLLSWQCLAFWLWPTLHLTPQGMVMTTTFRDTKNHWQDLTQIARLNGGLSIRLDIKKLLKRKRKLFTKKSANMFIKQNAIMLRYVDTYIVGIWEQLMAQFYVQLVNKLDDRIPKLSDFSDMTNELSYVMYHFFILRSPIRIT